MNKCKYYIGVACVEGKCSYPWENNSCEECYYNKGCEDCASLELGCCPVVMLAARVVKIIAKTLRNEQLRNDKM